VRFPKNQLRSLRNGFRVTRASLAGNAGCRYRIPTPCSALTHSQLNRTDPGSAAHRFALRSIRGTRMGGKFCRNGINCRATGPCGVQKTSSFIGFFTMARRLLMLWL